MAEYIKKATRKAAHGADPDLTDRVRQLLKDVDRVRQLEPREISFVRLRN